MRKEVIIAICIGLFLGLLITVGMYRARIAVESVPQPESEFVAVAPPAQLTSPTPEPTDSKELRLDSPVEDFLSREKDIRVTGVTLPNAPLIILMNNSERIMRADPQGSFSLTLPLESGSNVITVRAFVASSRYVQVVRTGIYSTQDFFAEGTASESASPTPAR